MGKYAPRKHVPPSPTPTLGGGGEELEHLDAFHTRCALQLKDPILNKLKKSNEVDVTLGFLVLYPTMFCAQIISLLKFPGVPLTLRMFHPWNKHILHETPFTLVISNVARKLETVPFQIGALWRCPECHGRETPPPVWSTSRSRCTSLAGPWVPSTHPYAWHRVAAHWWL